MSDALKILHVETGRHLYGGALQVYYLIAGLKRRGHRSVLVCAQDSNIAAAATGTADKVIALPMTGDIDIGFVRRLRRVIREEKPDLVHLHSRRGADVLGGIAARLEGVPVLLTRRVDNPEARWIAYLKYRLYDRVITISQGIRSVLLAEGVSAARVDCVPSAVDTDKYRPGCRAVDFRQSFGLSPEARVIGVVAQLIPRKGHRHVLACAPAVLAAVPTARFLLLGQGPLDADLRAQVAALGLEGKVLFAGFRTDLDVIMPCLDVVAHPAEMEGLGVALLQAAACAVPVVAAPSGGIPEVVRDGVNGYLVAPSDTQALAQCLIALLTNPTLAQTMGAAGRRLVEQEFSLASMVEGNLAVYRRVLAR